MSTYSRPRVERFEVVAHLLRQFKVRRIPIVIAIDIALFLVALFSSNPYQASLEEALWFSVLGFLSLSYLAYIEKEGTVPLRFIQKISLLEYATYALAGFFAAVLISAITGVLWPRIPILRWIIQSVSQAIGLVAFDCHVAIVEESFKVAFTNLFARLCGIRRKSVMRAVVLGWGTLAVGICQVELANLLYNLS